MNREPHSEPARLELLARQQEDGTWCVGEPSILALDRDLPHAHGVLVSIDLENNGHIGAIREAIDWILEIIEKYLDPDALTPEFVAREERRIEQWRQEIAVGSLELTRRSLEIETRREQLQELETALKREKEILDRRAGQLQELQKEIESLNRLDNHRLDNHR
ncbi:hypothetical protein [Pannus brasiliensis]|uniref:hypothetical protein n=1 Tax=Pannus brasiliensis TaxID=1579216 RepID=UPI002FCD6FF5